MPSSCQASKSNRCSRIVFAAKRSLWIHRKQTNRLLWWHPHCRSPTSFPLYFECTSHCIMCMTLCWCRDSHCIHCWVCIQHSVYDSAHYTVQSSESRQNRFALPTQCPLQNAFSFVYILYALCLLKHTFVGHWNYVWVNPPLWHYSGWQVMWYYTTTYPDIQRHTICSTMNNAMSRHCTTYTALHTLHDIPGLDTANSTMMYTLIHTHIHTLIHTLISTL